MRAKSRIDNKKTRQLLTKAFREAGKPQAEIARELSLHQSQVSRLLCGKFQRPSRGLNALCAYFGVNIAVEKDGMLLPRYPDLSRCLSEVLDGTRKREKAVVRLLKSARHLS